MLPQSCSFLWPFLSCGSKIALVAPSALLTHDAFSLEQSIQESYGIIRELQELFKLQGLKAEFYGTLNPAASYHAYYAAAPQERADAFEKALADPSVQAIFILRGGFGGMELVALWETEGRDPFLKASHKKPIIGFSDATYLLNLAQYHSFGTLHGPGGLTYQELHRNSKTGNTASVTEVVPLLMGQKQSVHSTWTLLTPELRPSVHTLTSTITGGNLSVLQRNTGTQTACRGDGKFVFLEDTERDPKRQLDLFIHLIRTGTFGTPQIPSKAILLGYTPFVQGSDENASPLLDETAQVYEAWLKRYNLTLPILYNPHFGHGLVNHLLPFGTKATLTIQDNQKAHLEVSVNQGPQ